MEQIIEQLNKKVSENIKAKANYESPEAWYSKGVKENMRFMDWLGVVEK